LKHLVEDKQHCIDYDTEILTKDGWKNHSTLSMQDEVATLVNDTLIYEKPLEIFDYPKHVGDMYYIKNKYIDMAVTAEHRMWVSEDGKTFDFMKAKDACGKKLMYKKDAKYASSDDSKKYIDKIFGHNDVYETEYKSDVDKIQQEAIQAGWTCTVYYIDEREKYLCKLIKDDLDAWSCGGEIVKNVEEPVWCIHVPSEVFLTRRHGKMVWTGNSRATGPYQLLTMQPAEGRSRDGGFRFGEMERDNMLSHGSVQFLKERTFDNSDKYVVYIDNETGMISPVNEEKGIYKSLYSDNTTKFSKVQIPYSSKLLIQELMSMHINVRLMVKK